MRAPAFVSGVVTQIQERFDVRVPRLQINARRTFALATLIHGRNSGPLRPY
jgi:hypothetical protein